MSFLKIPINAAILNCFYVHTYRILNSVLVFFPCSPCWFSLRAAIQVIFCKFLVWNECMHKNTCACSVSTNQSFAYWGAYRMSTWTCSWYERQRSTWTVSSLPPSLTWWNSFVVMHLTRFMFPSLQPTVRTAVVSGNQKFIYIELSSLGDRVSYLLIQRSLRLLLLFLPRRTAGCISTTRPHAFINIC